MPGQRLAQLDALMRVERIVVQNTTNSLSLGPGEPMTETKRL